MIINKTFLDGVCEIQNKIFVDDRGVFVKTFNFDLFEEKGLVSDFKESFFSVSRKNVLRGMHFQKPPHDHAKLIYVVSGAIIDVVVDIRENSPTFGMFYSTILSEDNAKSLYVDKGFAHGFLTTSDSATVLYMTSSVYNAAADTGIRWNSFGFEWPVRNPILSKRDSGFESLL